MTAIAGHVLSPAITVAVEDTSGNLVGVTTTLTIAVAGGPGTFTASSTTGVSTNPGGVATFNNLALTLSGTYRLSVSASTLPQVKPATLTLTVAPNTGVLLLDPSGSGALNVNGSGTLTVSNDGAIVVDSTSASSVLVAGGASIKAGEFDLTGTPGISRSGSGTTSGAVNTGVAQRR